MKTRSSTRLLVLSLPVLAASGPALARARPLPGDVAETPRDSNLVVHLSPCEKKRALVRFYMSSSKHLVHQGSVTVDGETFEIYLPKPGDGYRVTPREVVSPLNMSPCSSTCLAVDQNHDGELAQWESYYAELPLRIGDSMFDVVSIAEDGSTIELAPRDGPLRGAVIGRRAPEFSFTTIDGTTVGPGDFEGKVLIIDSWSPG